MSRQYRGKKSPREVGPLRTLSEDLLRFEEFAVSRLKRREELQRKWRGMLAISIGLFALFSFWMALEMNLNCFGHGKEKICLYGCFLTKVPIYISLPLVGLIPFIFYYGKPGRVFAKRWSLAKLREALVEMDDSVTMDNDGFLRLDVSSYGVNKYN